MSGKFIVIEGADGAGTTSVVDALGSRLGDRVITTAEPTSHPVGLLIRRYLAGEMPGVPGKLLEHLFRADRIEHVALFLRPLLGEGKHIICDRYFVSTLVYQSMRKDVPSSTRAMQYMYDEMFLSDGDYLEIPELTIFLDADVEVMAKRRAKRSGKSEIFEVPEAQKIVVELYREWFEKSIYVENKVRVDANQPLDVVLREVMSHVKPLIRG